MKKIEENIFNLPNVLTFSRVAIAFVAFYFIFAGFKPLYIVFAFVIAMLTDFFDGWTARRFNLKTEFGRQFDIIADRVAVGGIPLVFLAKMIALGALSGSHIFQILFMFSREIITVPIALAAIAAGITMPKVRFIGKLTTFLESAVFPAVLLNVFYSFFSFSFYLAVLVGIVGLVNSCYYIYDIKKLIIEKIASKNLNRGEF